MIYNKLMSDNKIKDNNLWERRYKNARFLVYLIFILSMAYAAYLVLFPSANFVFSFKNPDSSKNTIVIPRDENGIPNKNGKIKSGNTLIFDANPIGDFSEAIVEFTLEKKSSPIQNYSISTRRSYQSFFYPEGEKLIDTDNIQSPRLLSTTNSVFLASQDKIWPIADTITFESMGFNWNDLQNSNSEEIGGYEKQKLFTLKSPQPDGIVFFDKSSGKYYVIENATKRELVKPETILPNLSITPITADGEGLNIEEICKLEKAFSIFKKYLCTIPIEKMQYIIGNDYQFKIYFSSDVNIQDIKITFKKTLHAKNLRSAISILKLRLTANYYGQTQ